MLFFSTTSDEDFSKLESPHFQIAPPAPDEDLDLLENPHRWELLSRYAGCSCHYRHAAAELGFSPRVEWFPEDEDDAVATGGVYDLLLRILGEGHKIDLVDLWSDTKDEDVHAVDVVLSEVPRDHFRFLEAVRFVLT